MNLGENIYRLRTGKNMSQGDLAEALDVSRQSVSKWENNSATPELDKLIKMSELFGVSLDELVGTKKKSEKPVQMQKPSPSLREIIGITLVCLAILLAALSLLFGEHRTEAGIYFALLIATIGIACVWPDKWPVPTGIFAADTLFLLALAISGSCQSAMILAIPFLFVFIILTFRASQD